MTPATQSQPPSESAEQIAALAMQLEEMRQHMTQLEEKADELRRMVSPSMVWPTAVVILGVATIFLTFLLLMRR